MDDRVAAGDQRVDRPGVLERRDDDLFPGLDWRHRRDVAHAQHAREPAQARSQHAAEPAGGAGQEQTAERRRR